MLIVGIPTYNEADNIESLVKKIDTAAQKLNIPILIVNADNNSPDNTAKKFLKTNTKADKISILTHTKGKGINIKAILEYATSTKDVDACFFIDGDITSFEDEWLEKYWEALNNGVDYVIPRYKRNYQEGNTTNHFIYPLLGAHLDSEAPRQPISGDFGISISLANYLLSKEWTASSFEYGIDIFMTLHAIYGPFVVREILLPSKLHKPSFPKMVKMFEQVATCYYQTMELLNSVSPQSTLQLIISRDNMLTTTPISNSAISNRVLQALDIYKNTESLVPTISLPESNNVSSGLWSKIIILHERMIGYKDPKSIALSILPWYLLRSTTYLKTITNPEDANAEIDNQFGKITKEYKA